MISAHTVKIKKFFMRPLKIKTEKSLRPPFFDMSDL